MTAARAGRRPCSPHQSINTHSHTHLINQQEQYKNYNKWVKSHGLRSEVSPLPWAVPLPPASPATKKSSGGNGAAGPRFWPLPGDYSRPSRFTRLAMLRTAALNNCWNDTSFYFNDSEPLSPGFVPEGFPKNNPSLLAVMGVLNTAYLPRGVDDDGNNGARPVEFTPTSMLRDHDNLIYWCGRRCAVCAVCAV